MDWKLELVVVPVADQDRAKAFYVDDDGLRPHRRPPGRRALPRDPGVAARAPPAPWPSWPIPTRRGRSRACTWWSPTSSGPGPT